MSMESGRLRSADPPPVPALLEALVATRDAAAAMRFGMRLPGTEEAVGLRDELVHQLNDYLLPRLRRIDAPLLTVVGGSTGAGKSTLVNSLVRAPVSAAGVLRPTTRSPVLVSHPYDLHWFSDARVLPELPRTSGAGTDHRILRLVSSAAMDPGLAFLDAPDLDSVDAPNRGLAGQLLAAADLWLFVTTAARYADGVPWDLLATAQARGTALVVVLNRVPPGAEQEVGAHLREMLLSRRLGAAPMFVLGEVDLVDGLLPELIVAPLRAWFEKLVGDAAARAAVVRHSLDGALRSLHRRAAALVGHAGTQADVVARLREDAGAAYAGALVAVDEALDGAALLRGPALARWQDFVDGGELARTVAARSRGRGYRTRLTNAVLGERATGQDLAGALGAGFELLLQDAAARAAEQATAAWRSVPAGADLLNGTASDLGRCSPGFETAAERTLREWRAAVLDLARRAAGGRVAATATGVKATALLVMIVALTTDGAPGAPGRAAGFSARSRTRLAAAFAADPAVHRLARTARADLLERVAELLADERERFDTLLAESAAAATPAAALVSATAAVERAR